ncbi:hypothetical protein [Halochromatium glycolicum]|uniref:hypothetical protein n=1 Tax=Halochromatium glycolicum TaxID=85075 RepID=UPI001909F1AB|nr:hypothetical protein [Halochromatium glycolicum]
MSRTEHGMQRQRHGVAKNLAEGVGGVIVGAALVVVVGQWLKRRQQRTLATDRSQAEALLLDRSTSASESAPSSPSGR